MIRLDLLPEGQRKIAVRSIQNGLNIGMALCRAKVVLGESAALSLLDQLKIESIQQGMPNSTYIINGLNKACSNLTNR